MKAIFVAAMENPKVKVKFGFNHRYHEAVKEAKTIVDSGRLGKVIWMRGIYGKAGGLDMIAIGEIIGFVRRGNSYRSGHSYAGFVPLFFG